MNKKEFQELNINEFFHDLADNAEFKVVRLSPPDKLIAVCTVGNEYIKIREGVEYEFVCAKSLRAGKLPNKVTAPMFQELPIIDAIKQGLVKRGDKVSMEFEFVGWDGEPENDIKFIDSDGVTVWAGYNQIVKLLLPETDNEPAYIPRDNEICTVLTKNGFATKCRVMECKGQLHAIALKNDVPDGTFSPAQIKRFFKL